MKYFLLFYFVLYHCFSQTLVKDINTKPANYHIDNTITTDDRLWLNLVTNDYISHKIVSTDGTPEGTAYFDKTDYPIDAIVSVINHRNYTYIVAYKINEFGTSEYYLLVTHLAGKEIIVDSNQKLERLYGVGIYGGFKFEVFNENLYLFNPFLNQIDEIIDGKRQMLYQSEVLITDFIITKENKLFLFSLSNELKITVKDGNLTEVKTVKLGKQLNTSLTNNLKFILSKDKILCLFKYKFITIDTKSNKIEEPFKEQSMCSMINSDKGFWISTTDSLFRESKAIEIDSNAFFIQEKKIPSIKLLHYKYPILYSSYGFDILISHNILTDMKTVNSHLYPLNIFAHNNNLYVNLYYRNGTLEITELSSKYIPQQLYPIKRTNDLLAAAIEKNENLSFTRNPLQKDSVNFKFNLVKQKTESSRISYFCNDKEFLYFQANGLFYSTKGTENTTKVIKNESRDTLKTYKYFFFKNAYYFGTSKGIERANGEFTETIIADNTLDTDLYDYKIFPLKNAFLLVAKNKRNNYTQEKYWVSDGTKLGTKEINLVPKIAVEYTFKLGEDLLILNPADRSELYIFDGNIIKLFYKFEREINFLYYSEDISNPTISINGSHYIKMSNANGNFHTIYKISPDKSIIELRKFGTKTNVNFSKIAENVINISSQDGKESYLFFVDSLGIETFQTQHNIENQNYTSIKYPAFSYNKYQYATLQKVKKTYPNTYSFDNILFKIDDNFTTPISIFQFENISSIENQIFDDSLKNTLFIYASTLTNNKLWRIDKNTDKAYQFVNEKDKLIFTKWVNNKLYLNLCKNGDCHLYETDGTTKNTKKLTQKPLIIKDLYHFDDTIYVVADDGIYGFELWKINKNDEAKTDYEFEEVEMPKPANIEAAKFTKNGESISFSLLTAENRIYLYHFFPNPFDKKLTFQTDNVQSLKMNVFDVLGKVLMTFEGNETEINEYLTNNIQKLEKGTYLIQISSSKGQITKRLIKE